MAPRYCERVDIRTDEKLRAKIESLAKKEGIPTSEMAHRILIAGTTVLGIKTTKAMRTIPRRRAGRPPAEK